MKCGMSILNEILREDQKNIPGSQGVKSKFRMKFRICVVGLIIFRSIHSYKLSQTPGHEYLGVSSSSR